MSITSTQKCQYLYRKVYNSINVMFATILKITTISCDVRDEIKNVYNIKRKTNVNEE